MARLTKISAHIATNSANELSMVHCQMRKSFGESELSNVHDVDDFVCFDINNINGIPLLLTLFPNIQLYVNNNAVDMRMIRA